MLATVVTALPATAAGGPTGDIVYRTRGDGRLLALTFDDGPSDYTPAILDLLREQRIRATFCLLGNQVAAHPELVRRIVADGHAICNHTLQHEDLAAKTPEEIRSILVTTNDAIRQAAGDPNLPIRYFRAPYGSWGAAPGIAASLGMSSLAWTVDPQDWDGSGAEVISARLSTQIYPTAVVLSHDGGGDRAPTVAAYRGLIPQWKAAGWGFDFPAVTGGGFSCTAPAWGRDVSYVGGSRVSSGGRVYQANWWVRVEKPGQAPWVWADLGAC
ncbi:polysaccharide deacetylase family protein [Actinokineospora enzanensis]|uniref:polysaccharide deacetylase family protein n=1 Tax=Actinokineospora enzanensis TaxID=155975 RepID=UPI001B7FA1FF|nr:polysaccharide deacetylase family protein [Actinokineospora enzanensis]